MEKERIKQFYQDNLAPIETPPEAGANRSQPVGDTSNVGANSSYMGAKQSQSFGGSSSGGSSQSGGDSGPVLKPELPKGGGAIVGYGEQFHADGFTGGASLSFGGQSYNTGGGNGSFGMGFGNGSVGEISRRTSHGTPTYDDAVDQFLFNGEIIVSKMANGIQVVEYGDLTDLVVDGATWKQAVTYAEQRSHPYEVKVYQPMMEGAYSKIQYWHWESEEDPGENPVSFWQILNADNSIQLYGVGESSQVFNPADSGLQDKRIYKWLLCESLDTHGNSSVITYKREDAAGVNVNVAPEKGHIQNAQMYVHQVAAGQATPIPEPLSFLPSEERKILEPKWFFLTVHDYGEYDVDVTNTDPYTPVNDWSVRKDSFSTYFGGFEVRNHRLCRHVLQFHQFDELGEAPVLTQVTAYYYEESPICTRMVSSMEIGYYLNAKLGYYEVKHSVPIEMEWTGFDPTGHEYKPLLREYPSGQKEPFCSLGQGLDFTPVDLYSEGIDGLLYSDGMDYHYYQTDYASVQNDSEAVVYHEAAKNYPVPINQLMNDEFHTFQDITGNGKLDYVVTRGSQMGYYEVQQSGEWSDFIPLPTYATEMDSPKANLVNVCGDGRADCLMVMNGKVRYYKNNGADGFAPGVTINQSNLPANVESSEDTLIQFASIAGDGKSHLTKVTYDSLSYYPNYGYGVFGEEIKMQFPTSISKEEFKTNRIFFADTDGTGTADLLILTSSGIKLFLNQSGNSFAEEILLELPDGEIFDNNDRILFADVYGTGLPCLIYSKTHPTSKQWVYDFCNGTKPYLITTHINNIGAESTINFKSSIHFYLKDKYEPGETGREWITRAPFPTWVVESMVAKDAISGSVLTQSYKYRDSYYDDVEREFRGFGYVEHQDTDIFDSENPMLDSPPSILKSWFHTGNPNQQDIVDTYQTNGKDYFLGDAKANYLITMGIFDPDGLNPIEPGSELWREASILMKGTLLHSELYGLDGSSEEGFPYQVQNANGQIQLLQEKGNNYYASFLHLEREGLSYLYERNPNDPKMSYSAAMNFLYGEAVQSCSILYGRRAEDETYGADIDGNIATEQRIVRCYSDLARHYNFENAAGLGQTSDVFYQLMVPYEAQGFVITNLADTLGHESLVNGGIYDYDKLRAYLAAGDSESGIPFASGIDYIMHSWGKNYYLYALEGTSEITPVTGNYDQIETQGLVRPGNRGFLLEYYGEAVVFNQEKLYDTLKPYFTEDELDQMMLDTGGFKSSDDFWWADSGIYAYNNSSLFYQPQSYTNPMGATTQFLEYDNHNMMMVKAVDPLDNMTQILQVDDVYQIDYQHLQPLAVVDANGNRAEVLLDALGRVITTTHYGGEMELTLEDGQVQELYNDDVGFDSLYGYDGRNNPYQVRDKETDTIHTIIDSPYTYLQNSSNFFFYAPFSWMLTFPFEVLANHKTVKFEEDKARAWFKALQKHGLVNGEGAVFHRLEKVIQSSDTVERFTKELFQISHSLCQAFQEFSNDQQVEIFQLFLNLEDRQPVHVLAMSADDYPNLTHAILTKEQYYQRIPAISSDDLNSWWDALVLAELIEPNGIYTPLYRTMVQASSGLEDFKKRLENYILAMEAFDNFGTLTQEEIFRLQWTGLRERIAQVVSYNDGFGRSLQNKIKAEDRSDTYFWEENQMSQNTSGNYIQDIWLTEGLTVYNNKAQVVRQYDPFFINTVDFIENDDLYKIGTSPTSYYDALGRVTHAISPKGFLVYHSWTAWGQTAWDANDLLMISPYYLVNENNIFDGDETPPSKDNPYYEYFDFQMTDKDRNAYKKTLTLGWTPSSSIGDNRSLPWIEIGINSAQYTLINIAEFLGYSAEQALSLFFELKQKEYIVQFDSYETVEVKEDGVVIAVDQVDIFWGDMTSNFPLRETINNLMQSPDGEHYFFQLKFQAYTAKTLSLLFDNKVKKNAITEAGLYDAFVSAYGSCPFTRYECDALWTQLNNYNLIDNQGLVTDNIVIPTLDLDGFQSDNDLIVNYMFRYYVRGIDYVNKLTYDDLNRNLTIADPRLSESGYVNITYIYPDTFGPSVSMDTCDAGQDWSLANVLGRPMWLMDARNVKTEYEYDLLTRPMSVLVSLDEDNGWGPIVVTRMQYGEQTFDGDRELAQQYNYLGKPVQAFTQGGWGSIVYGFNIGGVPMGGLTKFAKPYAPVNENDCSVAPPIIAVPELNSNPGTDPDTTGELLKSGEFKGIARFGANNQVTRVIDPAGNVHIPIEWQSGGMRFFEVNAVKYMDNILYNAKKQHLSTEYRNEEGKHILTTFYAYDPKNYRLLQIYTESADTDNPLTRDTEYEQIIHETDHVRQNLIYTLDPIGNVSEASGYYQTPEEGSEELTYFPSGGEYTYDAMYRLVSATGYEQEEEVITVEAEDVTEES
ncbi:MAG: SpvB/TcaC N-terminal domain-containing protein [Reichenbachiella sp.]|uniref:SpvB/TcaC N-terminal domain-containing protein n=1 Tax=Reichenbachiella sp. TaxID=2184521 RepID=UPI00326702A9